MKPEMKEVYKNKCQGHSFFAREVDFEHPNNKAKRECRHCYSWTIRFVNPFPVILCKAGDSLQPTKTS